MGAEAIRNTAPLGCGGTVVEMPFQLAIVTVCPINPKDLTEVTS